MRCVPRRVQLKLAIASMSAVNALPHIYAPRVSRGHTDAVITACIVLKPKKKKKKVRRQSTFLAKTKKKKIVPPSKGGRWGTRVVCIVFRAIKLSSRSQWRRVTSCGAGQPPFPRLDVASRAGDGRTVPTGNTRRILAIFVSATRRAS